MGRKGSHALVNCKFETSLTFGDKSWMRQWLVIRPHFYFLLQLTVSVRHAELRQRQEREGWGHRSPWWQWEDGPVQPCHPLLEQSSAKFTTHTLTIRSDNHSPGHVTYRSEPHIFTKLYILLLIATASVITKHWIQSKCPSMLRECMGRYLVCWNSWMLANELVLGFSGKTGGKVRAIRTSSEDLSLYSRIQRMAVKAKPMTNISVFEGS